MVHSWKWAATFCACLQLAACGGDAVSLDKTEQSFNLAVSDAPVDGASKVVITIDEVEFRRDDGDSVIIRDFIDEEGEAVAQVQVDLLKFQGASSLPIIGEQLVTIAHYDQLILRGPFDDVAQSYVEELDAEIKPLKVPSDELKLGAIRIRAASQPLNYTIDFELSTSMNYKPGPDEYTLKPRGVRLVQDESVAIIQGSVDEDLFWASAGGACGLAAESEHYRRIYLYAYPSAEEGDLPSLAELALVDLYDPDVSTEQPAAGVLAPFAVAPLNYHAESDQWLYQFGFVPAGSYVVAYMCDGSLDDAEQYQRELSIPSISTYQQVLTVAAEEVMNCRFSGATGSITCAN